MLVEPNIPATLQDVKLMSTTNPAFLDFQEKEGFLRSIKNSSGGFMYIFEVLGSGKYVRTSTILDVKREKMNSSRYELVVSTMNSVYRFEVRTEDEK